MPSQQHRIRVVLGEREPRDPERGRQWNVQRHDDLLDPGVGCGDPATRPRAHVDEAEITLTRLKPQVALSVKASNFVAEAWSADSAEGRPWYERWGVDSTSSATTRGGCMTFRLVDCQIIGTPLIKCEMPEKLELVEAPNGVECTPFSGLGPLRTPVEDTPPEPPAP